MKRTVFGFVTALYLCAVCVSAAEAQAGQPGELFLSDSVVAFTLMADLKALEGDRSQESEERPGTVLLVGPAGDSVQLPVEVKTRGRYRLQRNICSFPPLRLNFQESEPKGTVFDGQDKLKLVTHCHDRNSFMQNVLEEYLAYRIYNQLTDSSFRVRLVDITYIDTSGESEPLRRMGFLLEDADALAERVGGMKLEIPGARATAFEPQQMGTMFLFQYMIGNIDWSTANTQNLEVLRVEMDHFAIPYDFDWSGLVDAPYAGPSALTERLHESVRERLYQGVCWGAIDFRPILSLFQEKRGAIMAAVKNVPGLSESNSRQASEYLEEFYDFIEDPDRAIRTLGRLCSGG
ncbi:MAG: hypothetical protein HKO65_04270 [Gemmatimonadetes bacterium]|nr:hypothetical protein [Gemmatimonadota bacterium]NNM04295.1 hypothetical protein [Gemmatimonadota bacterium]